MNKRTEYKVTLIGFFIGCLATLLLSGCKDLNSNPPPVDTDKMRIDVSDLQRQMGFSEQSDTNQPHGYPQYNFINEDTSVGNQAKSLLVGALVVRNRKTPYTNSNSLTIGIADYFGSDLENSAEYLKVIQLPISSSTIEFTVPPGGAHNWQVIAVAFSTRPELVGELYDTAYKNTALYYGVWGQFLTVDDIKDSAVQLTMQRVCLLQSPPKGCASYAGTLSGTPVVTSSVEIIGLKVNGNDYTSTVVDFPIFVRSAVDANNAIVKLIAAKSEILNQFATVYSLTIRTTHTENPYESSDCQDLANSTDYNNTKLRTHCEVAEYTVIY